MLNGCFNNMKSVDAIGKTLALLVLAALLGCQSFDMREFAHRHSLQLEAVTDPLPLRVLRRAPSRRVAALRVYLGGDGIPWRNGQPADNPTGRRAPLGLRLFVRDTNAHAYVGRPCYHLNEPLPPVCSESLWTSHRYSEDVVTALSEQVERLAQRYAQENIELIGHSGGGALALLVAARLPATTSVVTIAAPLAPQAWTDFHRLLPLSGSLSPMTAARKSGFTERHYMGGQDAVVPPALSAGYGERFPEATLRIIDGFDHHCCWESHWPELLEQSDP